MKKIPVKDKPALLVKTAWLFLLLLTACSKREDGAMPSLAISPTITRTQVDTSTPGYSIGQQPTPTARVFGNGNCSDTHIKGYIFFLRVNSGTGDRNHASYYDLYVMDGNGCSPNLVMPAASGSPAWSVDGKRLAVGCENNNFVCILDVSATLDTCTGLGNEMGECHPSVLQRYKLPSAIGGDERMYNISWAASGSQIAVEGGSEITHQYFVYTLALSDQGTWRILIQGLGPFNVAWSPTEEQIAFSGLSFLNLQATNVAARGFYPEWSPDGTEIAFVADSNQANKEPYGIASINLTSGKWGWLYQPMLRDDEFYFPPHNIIIRDEYFHRLLSWSPDSRYLVFVSESGLGSRSHIYRLDIATDEIVNLTVNIKEEDAFYAPAWGP